MSSDRVQSNHYYSFVNSQSAFALRLKFFSDYDLGVIVFLEGDTIKKINSERELWKCYSSTLHFVHVKLLSNFLFFKIENN